MRILITGATGLVGQAVLATSLEAADVAAVTVLGRRATGLEDPRLDEVLVADFLALDAVESRLQGFDACLYCAGAPPLGTREDDYRRVTVDATVHVARTLAARNPSLVFVYVSGANADAGSRLMPLRVKGEAEDALRGLPLRTVMVRPGGIQPVGGERSPHPGLAAIYRVAGPLMGIGVRLMPQVMTTTGRVARTLLAAARMPDPPAIIENADINRLGG
ncbi:MAG TPA: NAD(P)H-binding protein [Luteimonas sp.]|nr:NAD(P)H-binding protein [Luteimonas sp.]